MNILKAFINGEFVESKSTTLTPVMNPSTGEVLAQSPVCTPEEVESAVQAAKAAFPKWKNTPVKKRAALMLRLHSLLERDLEALSLCLAEEEGKTLEEARGDVGKAMEMTELAISAPSLLMGDSLMDVSSGYDTTLYREPIGVCLGLAPFNFPAMIPVGWMAPLAIVCGNCFVLKPAALTPRTSLRIAALYNEAGFPKGVLNIVPTDNEQADILVRHPDIKAVTFVGSTAVGKMVYANAAASGKRVQCLCEAKNHALVLEDAPIARTAAGILSSAFGCAGERCMALSVIVVQESIADQLIAEIKRQAQALVIGPAYDPQTQLGPLISQAHLNRVLGKIESGLKDGAVLALDGRGVKVDGYENGYYLGPCILDRVTEEMEIGQREIFGPVLSVKRVKDFEDGLRQMNANPFGNGAVIFTQNGHYAREFMKRTDGGMVGINVGIPVPIGVFPFSGHKNSFFGDLHCHGKDAFRFYTESKTVTCRWFDEEEKKNTRVDTWDGSLK